MNEWIRVEDNLPKEGEAVLIFTNGQRGMYIWRYPLKTFLKWFRNSYKDLGITHWMPLPEPPTTKGAT